MYSVIKPSYPLNTCCNLVKVKKNVAAFNAMPIESVINMGVADFGAPTKQ